MALALDDTPTTVKWGDIEECDRFDERRSAVDCLFANTIGVNEGFVEWCPNRDPPELDERLAWIWCIQPSLAEGVVELSGTELRRLVESYSADEMDHWWKTISA